MISEPVARLRFYVTIWQTVEAASAGQSHLADGDQKSHCCLNWAPGRADEQAAEMVDPLTTIDTTAAMRSTAMQSTTMMQCDVSHGTPAGGGISPAWPAAADTAAGRHNR